VDLIRENALVPKMRPFSRQDVVRSRKFHSSAGRDARQEIRVCGLVDDAEDGSKQVAPQADQTFGM
jgi:hypothetical protein